MSVEFEHFVGLNTIPKAVLYHPNGQNYVYASGANLVIGDVGDPHSQIFLKKHDDNVSAITISPHGSFIASGQSGDNSNIYVWDFITREIIFSFEEHDFMIQALEFSHDEKILVSIGNSDDRKLFAWDMSNGCIISCSPKLPVGTTCVALGGFVRDIKRRDTPNYLICTGGQDGLLLWSLDAFSGDMESVKITGEGRGAVLRNLTAIVFSDDREMIYGASTSGDFIIANVRSQRIIQAVVATKMGLDSILAYDQGVIIGCGDSTIKYLDGQSMVIGQTRLDGRVVSMSFSPDRLEVIVFPPSILPLAFIYPPIGSSVLFLRVCRMRYTCIYSACCQLSPITVDVLIFCLVFSCWQPPRMARSPESMSCHVSLSPSPKATRRPLSLWPSRLATANAS